MKPKPDSLSRREFAARAALSAVAAIAPDALSLRAVRNPQEPEPAEAGKLSPASQAEAEARYQAILSAYPDRFSDAQKTDLRRLSFLLQPQLDALRAWPVANSDAPALYLKPLVEREKKSNAAPNLKAAPLAPEAGKPRPGGKR